MGNWRQSVIDRSTATETQAAVTDNIVTDETTRSQRFVPELEQVARFIEHWAASGGAERANFPSFAHNLCDLLAVPHPEPTKTDVAENAYVFERDVTFQNLDGSTSIGRIDLYKRSCFVLEAKQGSEQTEADDTLKLSAAPKKKTKCGTAIRGTKGFRFDGMVKARGQAEQYASPAEGRRLAAVSDRGGCRAFHRAVCRLHPFGQNVSAVFWSRQAD